MHFPTLFVLFFVVVVLVSFLCDERGLFNNHTEMNPNSTHLLASHAALESLNAEEKKKREGNLKKKKVTMFVHGA